jgi:hypothetical protein
MATDYKKLLLNYLDKIIFVAFLVIFLVTAFRVVMSGPRSGAFVAPVPKKDFPTPEEVYEERYVLNSLRNPNLPDATLDFTSDPERISPGPGEKQCPRCGWIVPISAPVCPNCKYSWTGVIPEEKKEEEKPKEPLPKGIPFRVTEIARKPVDILFKGFSENPFKFRLDLQINWGANTQTSFVPLGETFHGYRLYPLEVREVEINEPGLPVHKAQRRFLTIRKPGEEPLVVEEKKTVRENEAYANLDGGEGRWDVTHRGEKIVSGESRFEVYAQYQLTEVKGEGRQFEVLAVKDAEREVVLRDLRDSEKKELVLKLQPKTKKTTVASTR